MEHREIPPEARDFGNGLITCNWYDARSTLIADHTRPTRFALTFDVEGRLVEARSRTVRGCDGQTVPIYRDARCRVIERCKMRIKGYGKTNENRIAEFEKTIGFSLPEDYRKFLLDHNGGTFGDDYGYVFISHLGE